eukprot:3842568-Rhodomonas_salina.3
MSLTCYAMSGTDHRGLVPVGGYGRAGRAHNVAAVDNPGTKAAICYARATPCPVLTGLYQCCALVVISKPRASAQVVPRLLCHALATACPVLTQAARPRGTDVAVCCYQVVLDRTVVNTLPSSLAQSGELYLYERGRMPYCYALYHLSRARYPPGTDAVLWSYQCGTDAVLWSFLGTLSDARCCTGSPLLSSAALPVQNLPY